MKFSINKLKRRKNMMLMKRGNKKIKIWMRMIETNII